MKYYIKQKVFSFSDRFRIFDADGNDRFYVQGQVLTLGKKLHLYDLSGAELMFIRQKAFSFLPRFYIERSGQTVAEVVREMSLIKPRYSVRGVNWQVEGDFTAHEYRIFSNETPVAYVTKKWLSWGDSYEIDISDNADSLLVLCVVLIIDAVMAQAAAASSST